MHIAMCIPGVPKKASPQIQNKERVTVRECKNLYLVKVIELRVIHLRPKLKKIARPVS